MPYRTAATCLHISAQSGQLHESLISLGEGNRPVFCRQIRSITPLEKRPCRSSTKESMAPAQSLQMDFQRDFETVKARVAIGRSLENLASLMKGSITELQGMMGGELGQSMQQLRQSAATGEGQMRATLDLAKEMGSGIARQQEARKLRGKALFDEYKKKMGMVQPEAAAATQPAAKPAEKQKIAE